jgi:DNA-binding GntR family transcriptional regulator
LAPSLAAPIPTAQQVVLDYLRQAILTREKAPGTALLPEVIADECGVSHVPVREALKILQGEGQVTYVARRGYTVKELTIADLREIYRLRDILETEAVRVAIPRLSDSELETMRTAMNSMVEAGPDDILARTTENRVFHFTLFSAARMQYLERHIQLLWDAAEPYVSHYYVSWCYPVEMKEHQQIFDAARTKDVRLTNKVMLQHRKHAMQALEEAFSQRSQSDHSGNSAQRRQGTRRKVVTEG